MLARRFKEDRGMRTAGSLTYATLLALVPVITVTLALMSVFPVFQGLAGAIQDFIFENLMPDSVDTIEKYAEQFVDNAAQLTTAGLIFLAITAIMLLFTIDAVFNDIWRVRRPRSFGRRLLIYGALMAVGPVLIGASLSLSSWLLSASVGLTQDIPHAQSALIKVSAVALTCVALAWLYYAMPSRPVRLRDALIGGALAALAFELTKFGFGYYIARVPTYTLVYGAFAAAPVFLLWLYISWVVVIAGAVLVATLPEWRQQVLQGQLVPGSRFVYALQVLKLLWQANGNTVTLPQLHSALNLSYERIEALLEVMEDAGWVKRVHATGWVLHLDVETIKLAEVYQRLVFDPQLALGEDQVHWASLTRSLGERIAEAGGLSLAAFFASATVATPVGGEIKK